LERVMLRSNDGIHHTSLQLPEEDFLLLLPRRACFLLILAFPHCERLWRLGQFDQAYPAETRKRLLAYYRGMLQRHLYARAPHHRLLSKNASFSSWIGSLNDEFPDARFIGLLRRPEQTVASQLSAIRDGLRAFGNDVRDPELVGKFVELMAFYYAHVARTLSALPAARACLVRYDDLRDEPDEVVLDACRQLGYGVSADCRQELRAAAAAAREYRSRHHYSLSEFRLTDAEFQQRFAGQAMDLLREPLKSGPVPATASTGKRHDNATAPTA
jgi:hypothetical protein